MPKQAQSRKQVHRSQPSAIYHSISAEYSEAQMPRNMRRLFILPLITLVLLVFTAWAKSPYPSITTEALPNGTVGQPYSVSLNATGNMPIEWFIKAGDGLPTGISLNKDTGVISGIPQKSGLFEFEVIARNYDGTTDRIFSIIIQDPSLAPSITTTVLADATQENLYQFALTAEGSDPIKWSVSSSSMLPEGLSLSSDGIISGTPVNTGIYSFYIIAENFDGCTQQLLRLRIHSKTPSITMSMLPDGSVGMLYSTKLSATGKTPMEWNIIGNRLPEGLTLSADGVISGTPQEGGVFHFLVEASNGPLSADTASLTISVAYPPVITSNILADGRVGIAYSRSLTAEGNKPLLWSISDGSLPDGLTLGYDTGLISGIPTKVGQYSFTVTAMNSDGIDSKAFHINVFGSAPIITTSTLPNGTHGAFYSVTISATGTGPITWSITGNLPSGLAMNAVTGVLSGVPTETGIFSFLIRAANPEGYSTLPVSIVVNPAAPGITTTALPNGIIETSYSAYLQAEGTGPFRWQITEGDLPPGLMLNRDTGEIYGVPEKVALYRFTVTAENITGSHSAAISLQVSTKFLDIDDHWGKDDINWAFANGLFSGTSETTFDPKGQMTRAMFITVLHRYAGSPNSGGNTKFIDVPKGAYYEQAVAWASANDIVQGVSNDRFAPDQEISREDLVLLLFRYANATGEDTGKRTNLSIYSDYHQIGGWAMDALEWAVAEGIIKGSSATTISPKGTAIRAEGATIFRRFIQRS